MVISKFVPSPSILYVMSDFVIGSQVATKYEFGISSNSCDALVKSDLSKGRENNVWL